MLNADDLAEIVRHLHWHLITLQINQQVRKPKYKIKFDGNANEHINYELTSLMLLN